MTDQQKHARMLQALAQAGGTHTINDVAEMVRLGQAQWWGKDDGCIVTCIDEYPQLKAISYFLVFGGLRDCLALQPEIDAWAIENGCSVATACGRPGWLRAAASSGWKLHGFAYQKALVP